MTKVREIFDPSKPIERRIEKVITYETTNEELLKQEVIEYVATESIQNHFETLLNEIEDGMTNPQIREIGVWVSGFYGSGKSSFTKYLGFALDPTRQIENKPFREWLQNQFRSQPLRARLGTVARKCPASVIMLDLASEMLAGATMAEISSVLYAKVMQWAGYSRDEKIAYLEFLLEQDGKMESFKKRFKELSKGLSWDEVKNQPLVTKALASRLAAEFYPHIFPDSKSFNEIKLEERVKEDDRVRQMLDLIERKTGSRNIIFILDEAGQYVAARDNLILNLDGLAKNLKNIGLGRVWIIATAQQTLTEDDPRAATNTAKLFKLKDRFPLSIDLEASDIKEICYSRLLGKSRNGEKELEQLLDSHGPQLRYATELKNTRYYRSELNKETFLKYYPFLPYHFDILLQLLARLAKTRGGVGLRSAIKVIQDVLVDPGHTRKGAKLLADEKIGMLATAVHFYDTLHADIDRPFPHIISGVDKAKKVFGDDSLHAKAAKTIAILQILEDFPVGRENVAAMMHPSVDAAPNGEAVSKAIEEMLADKSVPLTEVDCSLRFMSEAVLDLENERLKITPRSADLRSLFNTVLREIFTPAPSVKLQGTRPVSTGFKISIGGPPVSLAGDKEAIQTQIEFFSATEYDKRKNERLIESQQKSSANTIFLLGHQDDETDNITIEIFRCQEIVKQNRNKPADKEVEEYLRAQAQRAENLQKDLTEKLGKALTSGSFIFRSKPRAVSELGPDVAESLKKYLGSVAGEVFYKYAEAPVPGDSGTAEQFLKTEKLDKIGSKDDPLGLVAKKGGSMVIETNHLAIVSIKTYLEQHGQVDGRKLLDDFYAAPYGWSKDTTRYIVAAMLVGGIVKLRISGEDVTVRGDQAINNLKNTNSFNKIGVALRDGAPSPDVLIRARERLLKLTGEEVLPLEEEISKCVVKHFPDFQQDYAPLAVQFENLGLPGQERAENIQDNLSEILKGDASDATNRLGQEECPLFDDLCWAREVKKAFDNGIAAVVRQANQFLSEIPGLPNIGINGQLIADTESDRNLLSEHLKRDDFYQHMPTMRNTITEIEGQIKKAVEKLNEEQTEDLKKKIPRLQSLPEWSRLGTEDKVRIGGELDRLAITVDLNIAGLRRLINQQFIITRELQRLEAEIRELGTPKKIPDEGGGEEVVVEVTLSAPTSFGAIEELDDFLAKIQEIRKQLTEGRKVTIKWV